MAQIVFLDTNVVLDYLENRNQEVRDIIAQLLFFHRSGKIILATSVFNIAELIDKEFEIHVIGSLMAEKLSYDEIFKRKGDKKLRRQVAESRRETIKNKVEEFLFKNEIRILSLSFTNRSMEETNQESESYEDLYKLIYEHQFSSQDALIIETALSNEVTYFLSNDSDIVTQIEEKGLMNAYNLREEKQAESFKNNVLDTLAEVLR
ncbi:MAG: hypothetical protein WBD09_01355 [Halobacteriota archaeon]